MIYEIAEYHIMGGIVFMVPIFIMLLTIFGIIIYVSSTMIRNKVINLKWLEAIKHIGSFAAIWGTFSTLIGLFQAFGALERAEDIIPFQVIMGGLKVGLITVLYGLIVFCISQLAYIILKLVVRPPAD